MMANWFKKFKYKFAKELVFDDPITKILDTKLIMERDACVMLVGEREVNGVKLLKIIVRNSKQELDC